MVLIETITLYARLQTASAKAIATQAQTAYVGVRKRSLTVASSAEPGVPPSRANANSMREFDVTVDNPQNHMAPITIHTITPPSRAPSAPTITLVKPASPVARAGSPTASVIASSITNPATPDTITEFTIPRGAASRAPTVSSEACADAS